jgi:hypothetical protein
MNKWEWAKIERILVPVEGERSAKPGPVLFETAPNSCCTGAADPVFLLKAKATRRPGEHSR